MFISSVQTFQLVKIFLLLFCLCTMVFSQTKSNPFVKKEDKPKLLHEIIPKEKKPSKLKQLDESKEDIAPNTADSRGKNEISVWGGFSPDSITFLKWGRTRDARYGIVGVGYARRFNNSDKVNMKYTFDAIPLAVINFPINPVIQPDKTVKTKRTAYGFGVMPIGIQANFRPRKKIKPFVRGGLGILYFNKKIPNEFGKRLNFIIEAGGGVEIGVEKNKAITIGYKLQHVSNAFRGRFNPGFDNNVIYLGYTFFNK